MNQAISAFSAGGLTTDGLVACLRSMNFGIQYVAKTEFACSKIEKLSEKYLFGKETEDLIAFSTRKRHEGKDIVLQMTDKYRNKGLYINQFLAKMKKQMKGGEGYDT